MPSGDLLHGFRDTWQDDVVVSLADPGGVNEQRGAAGIVGGFGVLPFVAEDEGLLEIQMPLEGGFGEKAGFGFAAGTKIGGVMGADENIIEQENPA
jgi:hypothetical protein